MKTIKWSDFSRRQIMKAGAVAAATGVMPSLAYGGAEEDRIIKQAKKLGIPNINGLGMLLHQGCDAFKFWTDLPAPESTMQEQLLNLIN